MAKNGEHLAIDDVRRSDETSEIVRTIAIPNCFIKQNKLSPFPYIENVAEDSNTSIILEVRKNNITYSLHPMTGNLISSTKILFLLHIKGTADCCSLAVGRFVAFTRLQKRIPPKESFPLYIILSQSQLNDLISENYDYISEIRRETKATVKVGFLYNVHTTKMECMLESIGVLGDVCRSEVLLTLRPRSYAVSAIDMVPTSTTTPNAAEHMHFWPQGDSTLEKKCISPTSHDGDQSKAFAIAGKSDDESHQGQDPCCSRDTKSPLVQEGYASQAQSQHIDFKIALEILIDYIDEITNESDLLENYIEALAEKLENDLQSGRQSSFYQYHSRSLSKLIFGLKYDLSSNLELVHHHDWNKSNSQYAALMRYYHSTSGVFDIGVLKSRTQPLIMYVPDNLCDTLLQHKVELGKGMYLLRGCVFLLAERPGGFEFDYTTFYKFLFFGSPEAQFEARKEVFNILMRESAFDLEIAPVGVEISIPDVLFDYCILPLINQIKEETGALVNLSRLTAKPQAATAAAEPEMTPFLIRGQYMAIMAVERRLAKLLNYYLANYMRVGLCTDEKHPRGTTSL